MKYLRNILMPLAILVVTACAVEFPSSIPKCNAGDNECVARSFQAILQQHITGVPEIGLGSIDPFHFSNLVVVTGGQGPVSTNLTMPTGIIQGWKAMQVKKVSGFNKDPKDNKIELHVFVPKDTTLGKYTISGKILLLPISGNGDMTLMFDDLDMVVKIKTKVETRGGEDYLKIENIFCDMEVKKASTSFTNLFNDKALSDNMNLVLNQNEQTLFPAIKQSFGIARGNLLRDFLNPVFEMFPYRMFFAD